MKISPRFLRLTIAVFCFGAIARAQEEGNLIMNGGFEAGIQYWKGDGRVERLPEGNRVCEIEAAKNRMKDIMQEFRMKDLAQVEVVFRARSVKYTGPGLRISIHQVGGGSLIWNRDLPVDGSWTNIRFVYSRPNAEERRELIIATLIGTGRVQIDDVEVRAPSRSGEKPEPAPSSPPVFKPLPATPAPVATPAPIPVVTPMPRVVRAPTPAPVVPAGMFGSFEQIVQAVPSALLAKLGDSATEEAVVVEINEFLKANVKGKPALFKTDVEKIEPAPNGANKIRIKGPDIGIKVAGPAIRRRLWAYFPGETAPDPAIVVPGSQITIAGIIGRCDFTTKGGLQLNVDVGQAELKPQ